MNIEIKKLTPELLDDYLHFFDNVAFSDHKEWSKCYCMFFQLTDEMKEKLDETDGDAARDYAISYIKQRRLNGYLAYNNGEVAGWLNTDDKSAYYMLSRKNSPKLWDDDEGSRVKSLVCFTIAPNMRGQKIATRLLERALSDAAAEGYDYVEAYPVKGGGRLLPALSRA